MDSNICATYGYSTSGNRSYSSQHAFATSRLSTIAGYKYGNKEIIAPFEYKGTANKDLFIGWFEQMLCPQLEIGDFVILDNASIHKSDEIYDIAEEFGINIVYLPAYSPDLNPIEKVWANFKNILRRIRHEYKDIKDAITEAWNRYQTLSA